MSGLDSVKDICRAIKSMMICATTTPGLLLTSQSTQGQQTCRILALRPTPYKSGLAHSIERTIDTSAFAVVVKRSDSRSRVELSKIIR